MDNAAHTVQPVFTHCQLKAVNICAILLDNEAAALPCSQNDGKELHSEP